MKCPTRVQGKHHSKSSTVQTHLQNAPPNASSIPSGPPRQPILPMGAPPAVQRKPLELFHAWFTPVNTILLQNLSVLSWTECFSAVLQISALYNALHWANQNSILQSAFPISLYWENNLWFHPSDMIQVYGTNADRDENKTGLLWPEMQHLWVAWDKWISISSERRCRKKYAGPLYWKSMFYFVASVTHA